mgnify:CR=1 FL=1
MFNYSIYVMIKKSIVFCFTALIVILGIYSCENQDTKIAKENQLSGKTIEFSGINWTYQENDILKRNDLKNIFVKDTQLHIKLMYVDSQWIAPLLLSTDILGYGEYRFKFDRTIHELDSLFYLHLFCQSYEMDSANSLKESSQVGISLGKKRINDILNKIIYYARNDKESMSQFNSGSEYLRNEYTSHFINVDSSYITFTSFNDYNPVKNTQIATFKTINRANPNAEVKITYPGEKPLKRASKFLRAGIELVPLEKVKNYKKNEIEIIIDDFEFIPLKKEESKK